MHQKLLAGALALMISASAAPLAHSETSNAHDYTQDSTSVVLAISAGLALDDVLDLHKSTSKFVLVKAVTNASDYVVKTGEFQIDDGGTKKYKALAETWKVLANSDESHFSASGQVSDESGNLYDVALKGVRIKPIDGGFLYQTHGIFVGNETKYVLYYLSGLVKKDIPM